MTHDVPTPPEAGAPARRADHGGVISGWLVRLAAMLAVVGVLSYDAIAVAMANVKAEDLAAQSADRARDTWYQTRNIQSSYRAALDHATESHPEVRIEPRSFIIRGDQQITLTLELPVHTLVVKHVPPLEEWLVARTTVTEALTS
jgi:hypothetical protein